MKKTFSLLFIQLVFILVASAQDTLVVHCYSSSQDAYLNRIGINSNQVEFDICTAIPSFYVTVIDPNCEVWGTRYNGANENHSFGNINDNGGCRTRVERYFVYRQNDSLDLVYLDSLLNQWIPNEHTLAIWTPLSFNFSNINTLYPPLGTTLLNKWGSSIQTDSILVLFGVQGSSQSFSMTTQNSNGHVSLEKLICTNAQVGLDEKTQPAEKTLVKIVDLMGRETAFKTNQLLIYLYSDGTLEKKLVVE